jgi:hypothetical protein
VANVNYRLLDLGKIDASRHTQNACPDRSDFMRARRQGIKAVRGYLFGNIFISLKNISDHRQISALVADLRKRDAAVTPIGFSYSKTVGGR